MIKNRFLLYLLCGVMVSPAAALGECKPTLDCRALGYKEAPCPEQGVKCPFGETWYCPLRCKDGEVWKDGKCEAKGGELGQCTGYAKNCKIGDILNSDGTCSNDKVSGKAPIGVVVAIKDNCGWAMTASPIGKSVWSTMNNSTGAFQTTNWEEAIKDYNACDNTQKILQAGNSKIYPTAWAVAEYAPNGASGTKGKWCLPSAGIFNSLYTNLNVVNNGISKLGGTQLSNDKENIWSSTEYRYSSMWLFSTGRTASYQGGIIISMNNTNSVRPVIEF